MNDMDKEGADLRVDLLIDQIVARRRAGNATEDPALGRLGQLGPQEALLAELSRLGEIDWPPDQAGDRIAMHVAAAAGLRAGSGRRRWLVAGAAAAVALAAAGAVQLTGGPHLTQPGAHSSARPTSSSTSSPAAPPTWLTAMRVVGQGGTLNAIGTANINDNFLTCVSGSVCYTLGSLRRTSGDIARTVDGGATWTSGAPLPATSMSFDSQAAVSCPRPLTCFLPWGPDVLETSDGFAHFQVVPVSTPASPAALVTAISCPSVQHCVAAIFPSSGRSFAYSDDGGASWTAASSPAISVNDVVDGLRCDPDGACITTIISGGEGNPRVAAVTSTDGGRTWSRSAAASIVDMQQYMVSCANGRNCVVGSNDGYLAWVHATASDRVSIRVQTLPGSWGPSLSALSCAVRSCFMVAGNLLEATRDQGLVWTSTPLTAPAVTQNNVVYFSCPVAAGCVALANDSTANTSSWAVLSNLG